MIDRHPGLNDWLLLLFLALIWGSSFILMKEGLKAFHPEQVALLRIIITALVLMPFAFMRRKKVTLKQTQNMVIQGMFGNFIPAFLFPAAQTHINSSLAGILNSLSPVWVLIIGVLFFGASFKWIRLAGVISALTGAVVLLVFQPAHGSTGNAWFGIRIVIATISYGLSANIIKRYLHDVHPVTITSISFNIVLLPALIYLFTTDFTELMKSNPQAMISLGYIAILATLGSALASIIFNRLVHHTSSLFAASVSYLIPIVALMWGVLDGETVTAIDYGGMALIGAGVYLASR